MGSSPNAPTHNIMKKFGPKSAKLLQTSVKKERQIRIYKLILSLPGTLSKHDIHSAVWKYLLTFHLYYKPFSGISINRNVCALTSRTRSFYRTFQLSRMRAREIIGAGLFFGISKSSW